MKICSMAVDKTYSLCQHILRSNHLVEVYGFHQDNDRMSAHLGLTFQVN